MRETLGGNGEACTEIVWAHRGEISKKAPLSKRKANIWEGAKASLGGVKSEKFPCSPGLLKKAFSPLPSSIMLAISIL